MPSVTELAKEIETLRRKAQSRSEMLQQCAKELEAYHPGSGIAQAARQEARREVF